MFSAKAISRLSIVLASLFWFAFLITDMFVIFGFTSNISAGISKNLPNICFASFIATIYLFYRYKIKRAESVNFTDLLWKIFATGLITTIASLLLKLFLWALEGTRLSENILLLDLVYIANLALVTIFLISTFIVWKRLILYQKTKFLLKIWNTFEYTLLLSIVYGALPPKLFPDLTLYYVVLLILMGLFLSVNMRWVAYLNFKQKWKSILLIILTILYLSYFSVTLYDSSITHTFNTNIWGNVFLLSLVAFIFLYALFSLLVILFNLPTSSVFEKKLEEVVNFQKLSQSIQTDQSEDQVYTILLESSLSAVLADAGWIEIYKKGSDPEYHKSYIDDFEIEKIKKYITDNKIKGIFEQGPDKSLKLEKHLSRIKGAGYRSILGFPLVVQSEQIGTLALLKEVADGFDRESSNIIKTFVTQAEVSVENSRLISQAIENERYKEELKIAKNVQSSLLPKNLEANGSFTIKAFSVSADEVGGDYYDTYKIHDNLYSVIIGDVSGKGTSAAFHMSQMKGIFQSLVQLGMSSKEFLINANNAISNCLEKTSFITVTYFIINTIRKEVEFARAGHCPTIYYSKEDNEARFFTNKGLGLGILRNGDFHKYINVNRVKYNPGDIILLYTDGISEATNFKGEEYGYDRIKDIIQQNAQEEAEVIQNILIEDLYAFTGNSFINDDYTTLVIKFNHIKEPINN